MDLIVAPDGGGKSTALASWVREKPNRIVVCLSEAHAAHFRRKFDLGADKVRTIGQSPLEGLQCEVGIDNADLLLARILKHPVSIITVSD